MSRPMPGKRRNAEGAEVPCLTQAQAQQLLAHVRAQADQAKRRGGSRAIVDEIIVLILLHAGLRPQELCSLRIADTPVRHGQAHLRVRGGRAGTERTVAIPPEMVPVLQRFVQLHRKGAAPRDLLLLSERGTPFSYMSLYSKVRRIGQEASLACLHPGVLRHTFLVRLYEKEQDLRLVQDQAGHVRLKSTVRHLRPRRVRQHCEACNASLPPGVGVRIDSGQLLCPACLRELRRH
jgi:integrase